MDASPDTPPRILIVEDEIMIRMLAVELLADLGFEVDEAGTAGEALSKMAGAADVDAAIIDVGLPDRKGDDLALELRAVRPRLPILIATGYGEGDFASRFAGDPLVTVLGKPYDSATLRAALERIEVRAPAD